MHSQVAAVVVAIAALAAGVVAGSSHGRKFNSNPVTSATPAADHACTIATDCLPNFTWPTPKVEAPTSFVSAPTFGQTNVPHPTIFGGAGPANTEFPSIGNHNSGVNEQHMRALSQSAVPDNYGSLPAYSAPVASTSISEVTVPASPESTSTEAGPESSSSSSSFSSSAEAAPASASSAADTEGCGAAPATEAQTTTVSSTVTSVVTVTSSASVEAASPSDTPSYGGAGVVSSTDTESTTSGVEALGQPTGYYSAVGTAAGSGYPVVTVTTNTTLATAYPTAPVSSYAPAQADAGAVRVPVVFKIIAAML